MQRTLVRLGCVRVAVPDPVATAGYFEQALGFHRGTAPGAVALTCGGDYGLPTPAANIEFVEGPSTRLRGISFDLAADANLGSYRDQLVRAGLDATESGDDSVQVLDPGGVPVTVRGTPPPLGEELPASPLRPVRLGHTNLKVADPQAALKFYRDGLGLALSEQVGEHIYFLRAGSDHHNLGLRGGSDRTDVHHIGFEIPGWETYRVICDHVAALGHTVEYGPGRHGPGNNLFVYLREPVSGLRLELYSEMAHIDDDDAYIARRWEGHQRVTTVNRWGPQPPESFLE